MVRNTHIFVKNVMIFTVLSHLLIRVKKHKKKLGLKHGSTCLLRS